MGFLVGPLIGLGTSLIGDVIGSHQTSKAVTAQTGAATTAGNRLAPYATGGLDAYNKQRQMLGLPPIAGTEAPPGPAVASGARTAPPGSPIVGQAVPANLFQPTMSQSGVPQPGPFGSMSAQPPTGSSFSG